MDNKLNNQDGVTLVELLATILLLGIVSALAYSVLLQGYSNYQRIKVETELRDEADLIMASFVSDLFVAKSSELELVEACQNGKIQSFVKVTKEDGSTYQTGFKNDTVIVKGQVVELFDETIHMIEPTCTGSPSEELNSRLRSSDGVAYTINFTLETVKNQIPFTKEFSNTVTVIDD